MIDDAKNNMPPSDTTSANVLARLDRLSAEERLHLEMADARRALRGTTAALVKRLLQPELPRALVRRYPWQSVGAATAAGYVASSAFVRKPSPLRERSRPQANVDAAAAPSETAKTVERAAWIASLTSAAFGMMRSYVATLATEWMQAHMGQTATAQQAATADDDFDRQHDDESQAPSDWYPFWSN